MLVNDEPSGKIDRMKGRRLGGIMQIAGSQHHTSVCQANSPCRSSPPQPKSYLAMNITSPKHPILHPFSSLTRRAAFCVALAAVPSWSLAQIVANFDGGNSNAVVDAWQGTGGNGWAAGWLTNANANTTSLSTVINTAPLTSGSGNYVSSTFEIASGTGNRAYTIRRAYDGVDLAQIHEISFLYRLDALNATGQIHFYDDTRGVKSVSGSPLLPQNTTTTWNITANRSGSLWSDWGGINGDIATVVASTVRLYEGDTYAFNVELNPAVNTYRYTVTNLDFTANSRDIGTNSFTSTWLEFAQKTGEVHGQFVAMGRVFQSSGEFSLDSVAITQIPEPAQSVVWVALTAVLLAATRRRGHKL